MGQKNLVLKRGKKVVKLQKKGCMWKNSSGDDKANYKVYVTDFL